MNFSELYASIRINVPGAPSAVIDYAIREAARDFCRMAPAWNEDIPAINTVADQAGYTAAPAAPLAAMGEIVDIMSGSISDIPLVKKTITQIDAIDSKARASSGTPVYAYISGSTEVSLAKRPASAGTGALKLRIQFMPTLTATQLPDSLRKYTELLKVGALAKLFMIPGKPWSNAPLGQSFELKYEMRKDDDAVRARADGALTSVRVVQYGGI